MDDQEFGQGFLDRLQETIRNSQNEILVIDVYTKASEARLRFLERLDDIEFRLRAVEKKLMLRPPAA
jgi:hypothetical protein